MATSRTWGQGGIHWTPGNVRAHVYVPSRAPSTRNVLVRSFTVSEAGTVKPRTIDLPSIGEETSMGKLKALLSKEVIDVRPERMLLSRWGSEVADDQLLREVATGTDVQMNLQIRRRGASQPATTRAPGTTAAHATAASSGAAQGAADVSAAAAGGTEGGVRSLLLRSIAGPGRSAWLHGLSDDMEVKALRSMVSRLALAKDIWRDEQAAGRAGPVDEGKKAPPPKGAVAEGEPPAVEQLLLFGVGDDFEGRADRKKKSEDDGKKKAEEEAKLAAMDTAEGGSGGAAAGRTEAEAAAKAAAEEAMAAEDGETLVHLRDGPLLEKGQISAVAYKLRDYGLQHETAIYLCLDMTR